MGYLIPTNSPQVTVGTRTFAVACYVWLSPIGGMANKVAIYELQPGGAWNESKQIVQYETDGSMIKDLQAKGGSMKYLTWLITQINAFFAALFGGSQPAPVVVTEPTTDAEAVAYINSQFAAMKLTLVNGVPVMS